MLKRPREPEVVADVIDVIPSVQALNGSSRPTLRSYQEDSVLKVLTGNTIVILPTGAGKTLVAAEAVLRIQPRARALFLAPTCFLVEQQARVLQQWTGRQVREFMGGSSLPASFDVLVCTPKAFQLAQPLHPHLAWSTFDLVVFDEVHHLLKEHPYRQLATALRLAERPPRVLGLTASLTYAVTERHVHEAMSSIFSELKVVHIVTALPEELAAAGYHATPATAEVPQALQHQLPTASPGAEAVVPRSKRQPHIIAQTFFARVNSRAATGFSLRLVECIRAMEATVAAAGNELFSSPLERLPLRAWVKYLQERSKWLLPGCTQQQQQYTQLSHWYEALKLLVASWEEAEDASVMLLRLIPADVGITPAAGAGLDLWPEAVQGVLREFWAAVRPTYPRMEHLKDILRKKLDSSSTEFRGILFVEQRVMTHILEAVIAQDPHLQPRLRTACLYATGSPATTSLRVTPSQARTRLADFGSGAINLLITTVVAEEGMDVPAANCVIRFDPLLNAVSFVQGRGRARQADSSFVVLTEKEGRSAALLEQVEQQQERVARSYQAQQTIQEHEHKKQKQQESRETGALPLLSQYRDTSTASHILGLYVQRTKALVIESWTDKPGLVECVLRYVSPLRDVLTSGEAASREMARLRAAGLMIEKLRAAASS